jgi:hypothetical protein
MTGGILSWDGLATEVPFPVHSGKDWRHLAAARTSVWAPLSRHLEPHCPQSSESRACFGDGAQSSSRPRY